MYIKLKYIRISLDIYQHLSYHAQNKKKTEENNISTMKTHQMPKKRQYLTCIKVSFLNKNLQNDIVTPVNGSCTIIHNYKTRLDYSS